MAGKLGGERVDTVSKKEVRWYCNKSRERVRCE